MNNIYKVIWSKAKNCYVVASEIARSHTKSATGSEKIGGVARRSLLASLMALSLLCGGLGVASAADGTVNVDESTPGTAVVYTTEGTQSYVEGKLGDYYTKDKVDEKLVDLKGDVTTNKNNIGDLQTKTANLDGTELTGMTTVRGTTVSGATVEAGALKVKGEISNDAGVTTTLTDIKGSMTQTAANKDAIDTLQTTTNGQQTAIDDLKQRTKEISYADGDGTRISGVTIKDGNIVGNGNSAITELTNVETDRINGKSLAGTTVATEKEVNDEKTAREKKDNELEEKITKNTQDIATLDGSGVKYDNAAVKDIITLKGPDGTKITNLKDADLSDSSSDAVTGKQLNKTNKDLKTEAQTRQDMDTLLSNRADVLEKNTGGITRNDAKDETYIEKNVTVDNKGNVTAKGKLKGEVVDAGAVNAGSLIVENVSTLKGDVTMNQKLSVTGDTSLNNTDVGGKLNVTGESSLKNTTVGGTLTAEKDATFEKNVTVQKDLTVNGKLNVGEIYMEHKKQKSTGEEYDSATSITADGISNRAKVTDKNGNTTESKFTHNEEGTFNYAKEEKITGEWKGATSNVTADGVSNEMTDSDGNRHTYSQTATESKEQLVNGNKSNFEKKTAKGNTISITEKDAAGNPISSLTNKQTVDGEKTSVTNKDSSSTINQGADQIRYNVTSKDENKTSSSIEVKADGITNTSKDGTITNDAKDIVNKATGDMTNTVGGKLTTTVGGQATENFNSGLNTTVNGAENHTVNGQQTNTVGGGQINNITGGQTNNILTGDQKTTVSDGSIINKAEHGNISNTAKNVTNEGTESVTNKVGANEVKVSTDGVDIKAAAGKKITESVGTASRVVENDKITDNAGDSTVTTEKDKGTTFGKAGIADTTNIYGDSIKTGTINAKDTTTGKLTAGAAADANGGRLTVDADDGVKGSYKFGDYTSRSYILANTLQSGVDNGKEPIDADFVGSRTDHYMDGNKAKLNETVKDEDGSNVTKKTSTKTYTEIKDTNGNTLSVNQKADGNNYKLEDQDGNTNHVTNSATQSKQTLKDKAGNTLTTNQTATKNNFDLKSADGSKENHTTNTVDESRVAIKGENGKAELSTTDEGTTFKHSAAKEAFTEGGATNTTIKGNTITTGKVTMDYADVMKDLGVHGNATVDKDMTVKGNTTLGEAGKDTTLTVNSKAKFNERATFENGAEVKNGLTVSSGGLNVTGESMFNDKVTMKNGLDVTGGVASDSFTVKGTDIKIDSSGINAGGTVISNVADGSISEGSKDAVNGGQLYQVKNDLEGKVNKVGANAAAMANLHPMEFDPDSKWNIAAAMGNYGSETATAIGAFYRPNEDVMVNFSTAFGTGENMVGGGVSVRLGKGGNKLSREETNALKAQVADLSARMDALLSVLNPNMSKDFPDVPENHWAYEAVSRLAGNDIVQGYPDGEFHGDRTMTRYEMAEIIYNALSRGAEAERELVEEFKPELQAMAASEKATAERAEG